MQDTETAAKIIDTALRLAAERGWAELPLAGIAAESGVTLAQLYRIYPDKSAILQGLMAKIDDLVLAGHDTGADSGLDADLPVRDRLFDVLMRRFDALRQYRPGLRRILRERRSCSRVVWEAGPRFARSMAWMLIAAGVSPDGLGGLGRIAGLGAIYLGALRIWLDDESPDMARTMATLDSRLRWAEQFRPPFRRSHSRADPDSASAR